MEILIIGGFVFALLVALLVKNKIVIELSAIISSAIALIFSVIIALNVAATGSYTYGEFFKVDGLGAIVILIIGIISLATSAYSVPYLREEMDKKIIGFRRIRQYFLLMNIFLIAMYLAITANSPILAWIFLEMTTLSTAFLISFYNKPSAIEAAWKYLIINSVGLLLGFFGTLLFFTAVHSVLENGIVSWDLLIQNVRNLDPVITKIAFIFVLVGYGTKVGFAPMHTWKPDVYGKAPSPLGALFSGALLPVAFTIILKFKVLTDLAVGPAFSQNLFVIFGLLSVLVAAGFIYQSNNFKRILAYSSIEHAGIMALGFGFGGIGIFAAVLHMIYHALVKSALFFSAGTIFLKYSSTKSSQVRGMLKVIPVTAVIFIIGFLAITGMPPFGIFLTEISILSAGITVNPIVTMVLVLAFAVIFIGFFKQITAMAFGEKPEDIEVGEKRPWLLIIPFILLLLAIALSVYVPNVLTSLIHQVVVNY